MARPAAVRVNTHVKRNKKGYWLLINELDPDTEVLANSYLVIGIPKQKK